MCALDSYVIEASLEGARLDKVLAEMRPDAGLRLRRRLCDEMRVLVDGTPRKPGYKVRAGQTCIITEGERRMTYGELGLKLVRQVGAYAAIEKPGGVHSAAIAGKDTSSVEAVLPTLFPNASPVLLNRLDYLTSGLLLVALDDKGRDCYCDMEQEGVIRKYYLATVRGRLDGMVTISNALDTDDRKTTRVLDEEDPDPCRWTGVEALSHDREADTTMVRCLIMKGSRHQIRAHLASIGHPIVGDPLYGDGAEGEPLLLHHQYIDFPGFSAESKAPF